MDYILSKLNKKIAFIKKQQGDGSLLFTYMKTKVEYLIVLIMSCLWNKNFDELDAETKELILGEIEMPSIGTIVEVSRLLDIKKEYFSNKQLAAAVNDYPRFRNNKIGHGFTFEDGIEECICKLDQMSQNIISGCSLFRNDHSIVCIEKEQDKILHGVVYDSNGSDYDYYSCPVHATKAKSKNMYLMNTSGVLFRISPFVHMVDAENIFLFRDVKEKLLGKIRYNQVLKTGECFEAWDELCNIIVEQDGIRKRTENSTIINYFENNFNKYIEIGVKRQIVHFLTKNKSSVCGTIWGHGGIGKTASVQSVCGDLCAGKKFFDYIVFYSAKDKYYNYYNGEVVNDTKTLKKFDDIIEIANSVINGEVSADPNKIVSTSFSILLVIDDFETFPIEEKKLIERFIKALDINKHKVLVTTRANVVIGEEIKTNELSPDKTIDFLYEILTNEFNVQSLDVYKNEVSTNQYKTAIHTITSGRPIFIFQLAYLWMQNGKLSKVVNIDLKNSTAAFDFLYGRIFDYLSTTAKNIFGAISQLVDDSDLTNLTAKLAYIVDMEDKHDEFYSAINELEKLRIIETDEKFFKVYSKEILEIMFKSFENDISKHFKKRVISNIATVGSDNTFVVEDALLQTANSARYTKSEAEVVSLYENVVNRSTASATKRFDAISNVANYLASDRGKRLEAIDLCERHFDAFKLDNRFIKLYAKLCWSAGGKINKTKAITTIENHFRLSNVKLSANDKTCVDIFSLMLMYKSIFWIDERKQVKAQYRLDLISEAQYKASFDMQRSNFYSILNEGKVYLDFIHNIDINKCEAEEKLNIVNSLGLLVDVAIRVQHFEFADTICVYAMTNLPHIEQSAFHRRLELIDEFRKQAKQNRAFNKKQ